MRARPAVIVVICMGVVSAGVAGAQAFKLIGTKAGNLLVGTKGPDRLVGKAGGDLIKAGDGRRDRLIDGGGGANVCVIDIPADLPVTRNCGTIRIPSAQPGGGGGGGGGGGTIDPNALRVTSAQGLVCLLPPLGCVFTITGDGTDALVGTVTGGGDIALLAGTALNGVVTGTWVATGTYNCAPGATGWLVVTMGSKSTPQIPVQC